MIGTLRRRFLLIALASLAGTLTVLCLAINLGYRLTTAGRADEVIQTLYQYSGRFPEPEVQADPGAHPGFQITQETPFETRYFLVRLTAQREVAEVDTEHIAALDRKMVVEQVERILEGGRVSGYCGYYRYGIFQEEDGGQTIVVLDCFLQLQTAGSVLRLTVLVSLACVAIVFGLLLLSRRVVRPFAENLEKQRRFVTDASHELKTPLALCTLLLDNAVKYCDAGGEIRLTLEQRGRWAVLTLSNPCAGLEAAQLPRLFDRFYRADPSRSRETGGYGIGLSTARAIVRRHKGRLTAAKEGDVVTFTVRLPLT